MGVFINPDKLQKPSAADTFNHWESIAKQGQQAFQQSQKQNDNDTVGNGFFGHMVDAAQANAAGLFAGQLRAVDEGLNWAGETLGLTEKTGTRDKSGWLEQAAQAMDDVQRRNTAQEELTGLNYLAQQVGSVLGSMAAMTGETVAATALATAALPTLGVAAGGLGSVAAAARLAGVASKLNKFANVAKTASLFPKTKGAIDCARKMWGGNYLQNFYKLQMMNAPAEAIGQAGNLLKQLEDEGYDRDTIRSAALWSSTLNAAFLPLANMAEGKLASAGANMFAKNIVGKEGLKEALAPSMLGLGKTLGKAAGLSAWQGATEGGEEAVQEYIDQFAAQKAQGKDLGNMDWDHATAAKAFADAGVGSAALGFLGGGVSNYHSRGKNFNTNGHNFQLTPDGRTWTVDGKESAPADVAAAMGDDITEADVKNAMRPEKANTSNVSTGSARPVTVNQDNKKAQPEDTTVIDTTAEDVTGKADNNVTQFQENVPGYNVTEMQDGTIIYEDNITKKRYLSSDGWTIPQNVQDNSSLYNTKTGERANANTTVTNSKGEKVDVATGEVIKENTVVDTTTPIEKVVEDNAVVEQQDAELEEPIVDEATEAQLNYMRGQKVQPTDEPKVVSGTDKLVADKQEPIIKGTYTTPNRNEKRIARVDNLLTIGAISQEVHDKTVKALQTQHGKKSGLSKIIGSFTGKPFAMPTDEQIQERLNAIQNNTQEVKKSAEVSNPELKQVESKVPEDNNNGTAEVIQGNKQVKAEQVVRQEKTKEQIQAEMLEEIDKDEYGMSEDDLTNFYEDVIDPRNLNEKEYDRVMDLFDKEIPGGTFADGIKKMAFAVINGGSRENAVKALSGFPAEATDYFNYLVDKYGAKQPAEETKAVDPEGQTTKTLTKQKKYKLYSFVRHSLDNIEKGLTLPDNVMPSLVVELNKVKYKDKVNKRADKGMADVLDFLEAIKAVDEKVLSDTKLSDGKTLLEIYTQKKEGNSPEVIEQLVSYKADEDAIRADAEKRISELAESKDKAKKVEKIQKTAEAKLEKLHEEIAAEYAEGLKKSNPLTGLKRSLRKAAYKALREVAPLADKDTKNDLLSAGYEGILKAAKRFDVDRGVDIATYSKPFIKRAMIERLQEETGLTAEQYHQVVAYDTAIDEIKGETSQSPSDEQIIQKMKDFVSSGKKGIKIANPINKELLAKIKEDKTKLKNNASLNAKVGKNEDIEVTDTLGDENAMDAFDEIDDDTARASIVSREATEADTAMREKVLTPENENKVVSQLQKLFGGYDMKEVSPHIYDISLPNKNRLRIDMTTTSAQLIDKMGNKIGRLKRIADIQGDSDIAGLYSSEGGINLVRLTDAVREGTVPHEVAHFIFNAIFNETERKKLIEYYKTKITDKTGLSESDLNIRAEEMFADDFAKYFLNDKSEPKNKLQRMFEKMKRFLRKLVDMFLLKNHPYTEDELDLRRNDVNVDDESLTALFGRMANGDIYNRVDAIKDIPVEAQQELVQTLMDATGYTEEECTYLVHSSPVWWNGQFDLAGHSFAGEGAMVHGYANYFMCYDKDNEDDIVDENRNYYNQRLAALERITYFVDKDGNTITDLDVEDIDYDSRRFLFDHLRDPEFIYDNPTEADDIVDFYAKGDKMPYDKAIPQNLVDDIKKMKAAGVDFQKTFRGMTIKAKGPALSKLIKEHTDNIDEQSDYVKEILVKINSSDVVHDKINRTIYASTEHEWSPSYGRKVFCSVPKSVFREAFAYNDDRMLGDVFISLPDGYEYTGAEMVRGPVARVQTAALNTDGTPIVYHVVDFFHPDVPFIKKQNVINLQGITEGLELSVTLRGSGEKTRELKKTLCNFGGSNGAKDYTTLSEILGSDKKASLLLNEYGIPGLQTTGRRDGGIVCLWDDNASQIVERFQLVSKQQTSNVEETKAMVDKATEMYKNGATDQEVWNETCCIRYKDGTIKLYVPFTDQDIISNGIKPDTKADITNGKIDNPFYSGGDKIAVQSVVTVNLSDMLASDNIFFRMVPSLRDVKVRYIVPTKESAKLIGSGAGVFEDGVINIQVDKINNDGTVNFADGKNLAHELQHAIQQGEGGTLRDAMLGVTFADRYDADPMENEARYAENSYIQESRALEDKNERNTSKETYFTFTAKVYEICRDMQKIPIIRNRFKNLYTHTKRVLDLMSKLYSDDKTLTKEGVAYIQSLQEPWNQAYNYVKANSPSSKYVKAFEDVAEKIGELAKDYNAKQAELIRNGEQMAMPNKDFLGEAPTTVPTEYQGAVVTKDADGKVRVISDDMPTLDGKPTTDEIGGANINAKINLLKKYKKGDPPAVLDPLLNGDENNQFSLFDLLRSPFRLAKKFPKVFAFFEQIFDKAYEVQNKLRYGWHNVLGEATGFLQTTEEFNIFNDLMLYGDSYGGVDGNGIDFTAEQLNGMLFYTDSKGEKIFVPSDQQFIEKGVETHQLPENVAKAYLKVRELTEAIYAAVDRARRSGVIKSEKANLKRILEIDSPTNRAEGYVEIKGSDGEYHSLDEFRQYLNDTDTYDIRYAKIRVVNQNAVEVGVTEDRLNEIKKDDTLEFRSATKTPNANGLYDVVYTKYMPHMGHRRGHVPHIFERWLVAYVQDDGTYVIQDSKRTLNQARESVTSLQNSDAEENIERNYVIFPKAFDFGAFNGADEVKGGGALATQKQKQEMYTNLVKNYEMKPEEANRAVNASVRTSTKNRIYGQAVKRKGKAGFSKDVIDALEREITSASRYCALQPAKHGAITKYENLFGVSYDKDIKISENPLQAMIHGYIDDCNGKPSKAEQWLNRSLNNWKFYRENISASYGDRAVLALASKANQIVSVAKLGFWNISSAVVNLFQSMNTVALCGFGNFGEGLKAYKALKTKDKDKLTGKELEEYLLNERIIEQTGVRYNIGMDSAMGYQMRIDRLKNKADVHTPQGLLQTIYDNYMRIGNKGLVLFSGAEAANRQICVLTAYRDGISKGMSHEEAIEYAKEVNKKANFDYGVADTPAFMRAMSGTGVGEMMMLFQKYPVKELELMCEMCKKAMSNTEDEKNQAARFWGLYFLMSGIGGIPFLDGFDDWLEHLFGYRPSKRAKLELFNTFGDNAMTRSVCYGVGALAGVDLSQRVGMGDLKFGNSQLMFPFNFGGAAGSTLKQMIEAAMEGDTTHIAKAFSPAIGAYFEAIDGYSTDKKGRLRTLYSVPQIFARAGGFRPVEDSINADLNTALTEERSDNRSTKSAFKYHIALKQTQGKPLTADDQKRLREMNISGKQLADARKQIKQSFAKRAKELMSKEQRQKYGTVYDEFEREDEDI